MDHQKFEAHVAAVKEHLQEHELQHNWCGFDILRLEAVENCDLFKFPSCCEHVNMFCLFVTLEC